MRLLMSLKKEATLVSEARGCKMTLEQAKEVLIVKAGYGDFVENILCQIYNDFEAKIDKAIAEAEDSGWYEYDDKNTCIELLYQLKDKE